MGDLINTGRLTGITVHSARIDLATLATNDGDGAGSALNSDYTQEGPRPGSAVANDSKSTLDPQVHAAQDTELDLLVVRSGIADLDSAGLAYREEGEADTAYRGWNEANLIHHWTPVEWTTTEEETVWIAVFFTKTATGGLMRGD